MTLEVQEASAIENEVSSESVVPEEVARDTHLGWRLMTFVTTSLALAVVLRDTLVDLARLSMRDETYSHMPLIPLVTLYFLFVERKRIFSEARSSLLSGAFVAAVGACLCFIGLSYDQPVVFKDQLSLITLGALILWLGGFIAVFGMSSFRTASFPLLFLLFIVPIPMFLLDGIVLFLRQASTEVASALFTFTGVPVLRDGFIFELPGMSVMVADECCGIRSSISLFITGCSRPILP